MTLNVDFVKNFFEKSIKIFCDDIHSGADDNLKSKLLTMQAREDMV
jgi:hypothetical protein